VDLEAAHAGHVVVERADLAAGDLEVAEVEERDLGERALVHALDELQGIRALDLVAVDEAAAGVGDGALVARDLHVVFAADWR
jgi:hypothetical protein